MENERVRNRTEEDNEKTSETAVTDSSTIKVKVPLSRGFLLI